MPRAPVYYIAHGGPPTMFDPASGAYQGWAALGKRILSEVQSGQVKGLVCVSAHWEGEELGGGVLVNNDSSNPLIYDYYNFPAHYYRQTFHSTFPSALPGRIVAALKDAKPSIPARTTDRGLDHGLFVPFKVMFGQEPPENGGPTDGKAPPIIQLSMAEGVEGNAALGKALGTLRDEGYAIVATGQPVHNLRFFRGPSPTQAQSSAFVSFFRSLVDAATGRGPNATSGYSRDKALADVAALPRHPAYKLAHPTDEHFLPLVIASAAATANGDEQRPAEVIYEESAGPLGWAFFRWD